MSIKCPALLGTIWRKINFLEFFGVKTQWIIGQKSRNRARYAGAFWGKITFFGRKVNKVPCIIVAIWGKNNLLGIFGVKTQWIIGQKSQNGARYVSAFWGKNQFFGRKVNKVPCIIDTIWGKKSYIFEIFTNYHSMMVIFFKVKMMMMIISAILWFFLICPHKWK